MVSRRRDTDGIGIAPQPLARTPATVTISHTSDEETAHAHYLSWNSLADTSKVHREGLPVRGQKLAQLAPRGASTDRDAAQAILLTIVSQASTAPVSYMRKFPSRPGLGLVPQRCSLANPNKHNTHLTPIVCFDPSTRPLRRRRDRASIYSTNSSRHDISDPGTRQAHEKAVHAPKKKSGSGS